MGDWKNEWGPSGRVTDSCWIVTWLAALSDQLDNLVWNGLRIERCYCAMFSDQELAHTGLAMSHRIIEWCFVAMVNRIDVGSIFQQTQREILKS